MLLYHKLREYKLRIQKFPIFLFRIEINQKSKYEFLQLKVKGMILFHSLFLSLFLLFNLTPGDGSSLIKGVPSV